LLNIALADLRSVCQFKPNSREESESTWQDFWLRLKEALGRSVERVVEMYKREVKKLLSERPLPGWNFCKYFTVVEGLAFVYEALRLYDDALKLYDDLEGFQLSMDEREIALPMFGGTEKGDDSGSVLDFNKKNYRMKIATSTITEFDFRQYLFARQCKLLFCYGRPVKLAERAMNFIRTFTRLLCAEKFNERYCNSWAFTAYMDVAETLRATILRGGVGGAVTNMSPLKSADPAAIAEHLAKTPKLSSRNLQKLNYLLGDIYYNARVTLEHLGSSYNLLPHDTRVILSQESLKQFNIIGLESTNAANQVLPTNRKLFLEEGKNDVQLMEILDSDTKPDEKLEEESLDKENARKALEQLSLSQSPPGAIIPPPEGVHESEPLTDVKEITEPVPMSPEKKKKRRRGSLRSKTDKNSDNSDESDESDEDEDKTDSVDQSAVASDSVNESQPGSEEVNAKSTEQSTTATSDVQETKSADNAKPEDTENQHQGTQSNENKVEEATDPAQGENKGTEPNIEQSNTDTKPEPPIDAQSEHKSEVPKTSEDNQTTESKSEAASDNKSTQNTPSSAENTAVTPVKNNTPTSPKRDKPAYQSGKVDFSKIRDGTFEITHPILITGTANEASFDKLYTSLTNKAIQCFTDVERHRSVMRLSQELGNLHFVRGNYDNAVTLLKSVLNLTNSAASAGSSVDNWHPLSFVVHHRLALVHLMNNDFNDFLTSLIELLSPPMLALLDDHEERARLQQWYFDLLLHVSKHKLSVVSEQSMSSVIEPAISFPGFGFTRQCNMRDTVTINVHLTSSLPQILVADKLCLQLFSQKRAAKNSKLMSGDKTPRGGEEKPNFVVIDLTAVNVVPGKNVYSLTFKPPSKSRYICYKLWIEIGNLILSQTLLPPSIDNPHQLQRKHYKTFNYNNIANNQRIWSINVAHSSPTALLHVNLPEHGHMVVGCWQTVQVVIDTEDDQLTNKPSLYIKSKNLITTTGSAVQTPLEESSDGITDTPQPTPEVTQKEDKSKDNKGPVEFPLVIPDKCQLKARVTTGDMHSEVTVQLLNGQVMLPTLGTRARIEFDLPLKALHSTDHIHEVSFTLKYREACNEKFVINQLSDLNFIQPFNTAQFILANKPNNRILLRVILESLCPSPIEIIEYRRDASADEGNKDFKAVLDYNHYIKAMTIKPKEKVSLLFELEKLVQKSATQGTSGALKASDEELINNALLVAFTFYYRFTKYEHKEIGKVKVEPRHNIYNTPYLEWKHFVHFDELNKNPMLERSLTGPMPSDQYDYEYSLSTPHADEPHLKGRWIHVTVRVHRLAKTPTAPPAEISYRLEYDTASWLVSGKIRGYLRPSATGHEHVLNFRMLPLVAGQLPLPSLQLDNLSVLFKSTNINHHYYANYAQRDDTTRDQHVIVFPQTNVMSVTEKIVLNDPLSKPYFT
jgi:tetratricopeptide (TPR) repeat protein